jgi:hypothetical protein
LDHLYASIQSPTQCKDLVLVWPDFIGIVDALSHGIGGVVIGELSALPLTVFRFQWPSDISQDLVSFNNPKGEINNSNLEMVGLLFLWLSVEPIALDIAHKHIMLFSNNSLAVSWVDKMGLRRSRIAAQLIRTLALWLNINKTCPLTPVHIPGVENALTDIPSRLFCSVKEWEYKTDNDLLTLFNQNKSPPKPGIVDGLPIWHRNDYASDFRTAAEGYYAGRVAATIQNWKTHWANWTKYVQPLGLDLFL